MDPAPDHVCEDLLLAILDELPSRTLVKSRGVSRCFAILADEILRRRFLAITKDDTNELILESCAPYETRSTHRQALDFSHFGPSADIACPGDVAHFVVKAPSPTTQFLPLDDGELFGNNLLAVHLRNSPRPSMQPQRLSADDEDVFSLAPSAPRPPRFINYAFSLNLASSLDRFFRSWFLESALEEAQSECSSPASSELSSPSSSRESSPPLPFALDSPASPPRPPSPLPTSPRLTRPKRIASPYNPRSSSALFAAEIECVQVPRSVDDGDPLDVLAPSPPSSYSSTPPRLFEYFFSRIEMDVARVVVAAEENLPRCGRGWAGGGKGRGRVVSAGPVVIVI
ncbi:hypothetical protein NBRC10512_004947 [Rhodotorula toruloides]|uniref:RHTO0S01e13388g1_1 n=2 Tax=Rhodotorula toruloides TaxID=5286 RepID=A0A061AG04_RHOTO|nr:uncharacterized protein RHTO_04664 [Rhodotorula toruloides NP11]EMS24485.1 hypothetical protein RHTO_04664 [Rhodotorula toruloides NP11]CDR36063.1 RHTO0S01e13388g1_1 [Rhodotorula toruloides]